MVCKVFESIIQERMLDHLFSNAGLDVIMSAWVPTSEVLHGFLPRKSCMTQLLHALNDWTESLDRGNSIDGLYLDFKKAFESVPHARLLRKVHAYGFRRILFNWLQDFLTEHKQRVSVNGSLST